ncbi:hypothetical protein QMA09_16465 [Planococcus sp. APC 3906]|uniref:hypothetical protein n=1 Tax=Planococcus sp. APC 3906 TaxID=3035194 RepID=UPI0025B4B0DB|nr:hypothetical protein [Planococcus sp. APC 3906]MDN3451785.1 hypothetical protein [Planococcus sp. APC 3906]
MRKLVSAGFVSLIVLVSGCNHADLNVSEDQAKSKVIELRSGHIGNVEILSIELKRKNYIVEWENEENCEHGVDSVDGENVEIELISAEIC